MSEATLRLDFPACLAKDFPQDVPAAARAVDCVLEVVKGRDVVSLASHSPELAAFDWTQYLRGSIARMAHISAALRRRGITGGRLLDYGSYFGNVSTMFATQGFTVDAADSYTTYGSAFEPVRELLQRAHVNVLDFDVIGRDLHGLDAERYDVVLCLGVIEHIPHTPRLLLDSLIRVLKTGGCLVIDTPSHAYIYNRQRLAKGESVMAHISPQFYADPPFEGHHREYTPAEMAWMLEQSGQRDISIEMFNYSFYGLPVLTGIDLANYWATALDPLSRELIMAMSVKSGSSGRSPSTPVPSDEAVRRMIDETEPQWVASIPDDVARALRARSAEDVGARKLEDYYTNEIAVRDRDIAAAHERIGALQRELDARLSSRLGRLWKRFAGRDA